MRVGFFEEKADSCLVERDCLKKAQRLIRVQQTLTNDATKDLLDSVARRACVCCLPLVHGLAVAVPQLVFYSVRVKPGDVKYSLLIGACLHCRANTLTQLTLIAYRQKEGESAIWRLIVDKRY